MKNNFYYFIASPYNGSDKEKQYRYEISQIIVTDLLEKNISSFAPILYNQLLINSFEGINLENRRKLLMPMNIDFLYQSKGMILLKIPGWDDSWGLSQYIEICKNSDIAIFEVDFTGNRYNLDLLINNLNHV